MEVLEEIPEVPAIPEVPETPEQAEPHTRPRGRTALLIAGAVVLGLVAGTCTGFLIQADREPTKLPSLSQSTLAQAKGEGPEPLSASVDPKVKTDGDLRKLLLKRPAGLKEADWVEGADGWVDLAGYADAFDEPGEIFGDLVGGEFRRLATTGWEVSSTYGVQIRLVQFRQEEALGAADRTNSEQYWADDEDTDSWPIPGTGEGMVYVHNKPKTEPGYLPQYFAEASAWRGDVAVEIYVWDSKPIPKAKIMDLAKRQMGRL